MKLQTALIASFIVVGLMMITIGGFFVIFPKSTANFQAGAFGMAMGISLVIMMTSALDLTKEIKE